MRNAEMHVTRRRGNRMKRYTAGIASDDLYNEDTSSVLKHNHLSLRAELRLLLVCCRQAMGSQLSKRIFESKQYRCINPGDDVFFKKGVTAYM